MTCVACERPNLEPAPKREFCRRCWDNLPRQTREAFESGRANIKRVVSCSRERNRSVRAFGGGRKS
jgi:hypothetical protein